MGNCICFRNTLIYVICWDQVLLFITLLWFLERFYSLANGWATDQPKAVVDQTLSNIIKHQMCNDMEQKKHRTFGTNISYVAYSSLILKCVELLAVKVMRPHVLKIVRLELEVQ